MAKASNTNDNSRNLSLERRVWNLYQAADRLSWQLLNLWETELACHWCSNPPTVKNDLPDQQPNQ